MQINIINVTAAIDYIENNLADKPIIEIALIAGYESQQAFTTIFKLMYKKSPNRYREAEEFYSLLWWTGFHT